MLKPKSILKLFTETGPLIVLAVTIALVVGIVGPASAQFFNFGGPQQRPAQQRGGFGGGGWFGSDFFTPFQPSQAPKRVYQDFSKAPPPEKRADAAAPERNVLVLGDGMADWLAYWTGGCLHRAARHGRDPQGQEHLRPDQVPAQGRSGRLGRRRQGHPCHREARRHRRHARPQRPRLIARARAREDRQAGGQENRQEGRARQTRRQARCKG